MANVPVGEKIGKANDLIAAENRRRFDEAQVRAFNFMASPGAGKTSLVERTLKHLGGRLRVAMVSGETNAAAFDAERAERAGAVALHINTTGKCHLEAGMIRDCLDRLPLADVDVLIVENIGNLVCPSSWQLGVHRNVLIASVPEGHDKPYKYPAMYRGADALVINKIDLLPYVPFDMEYFRKGVEVLNPGVQIFPMSCRTGEGVDAWCEWLSAPLL